MGNYEAAFRVQASAFDHRPRPFRRFHPKDWAAGGVIHSMTGAIAGSRDGEGGVSRGEMLRGTPGLASEPNAIQVVSPTIYLSSGTKLDEIDSNETV